jgi:cyclopropane fatty-acyl-phospholipid synthase-like methyltransferase
LEKLRRGKLLPGNLSEVVRRYIRPFLNADSVALEIGCGGGRWTQFLLGAREVIAVDLNPEFFDYIEMRFAEHSSKFRFYPTRGYELDGVGDSTVDFVFSFGTLVHIEHDGIALYLEALERVMKPGAIATLQYADKSKRFFRSKSRSDASAFSEMDKHRMSELVRTRRFRIVEHDCRLLNHSNIIVIQAKA